MNSYFQLKDQVCNYLDQTNNLSFDNIYKMMKSELQSMGVIDGGDPLRWKTPDGMYLFEIDRVGNSFILDNNSPEYTNIIKIKNNIGIQIMEMRFSEYQCINILSSIAFLCQSHFYDNQPYREQTGLPQISDCCTIHINPNDTRMTDQMIEIEFSITNPMICRIKFLEYNLNYGKVVEIFHFTSEYDTLVDMCFMIFFQCIIDLDLDKYLMTGWGDELYIIEDFVYGGVQPMTNQQNLSIPVYNNENQDIIQNQEIINCIEPKNNISGVSMPNKKVQFFKTKKQ